jgi:lipopolysaccharide export LptBFGC system permease protein LptF
LVYFGLFEWGTAIAATESPLTLFALWTPNIALGLLGLGMLWWISKR